MTLGEIIRKYRKANNLSIYNLAKSVGISHSYINQIEHGKKKNPDNVILIKISIVLKIPFGEIINIKIKEFEDIIESSDDKLILTANKKNLLRRKLYLLNPEDLIKLESYVDSLLLMHCD
jgi:transcriptional regulator with XRE-family HTH domain